MSHLLLETSRRDGSSRWNRNQIELVVRFYYGDMVRATQRWIGRCGRVDPALDAEDIVHEYLVTCYEKGWLDRDPTEIQDLRAYVFVQLRRFAWSRLARRAPHELLDMEQIDDDDPDPEPGPGAVDPEALRQFLEAGLEDLREGQPLHALILSDWIAAGGRSSDRLRAELGRSPKALDALRYRARQGLRKSLRRIASRRGDLALAA